MYGSTSGLAKPVRMCMSGQPAYPARVGWRWLPCAAPGQRLSQVRPASRRREAEGHAPRCLTFSANLVLAGFSVGLSQQWVVRARKLASKLTQRPAQ